MDNRHPGDSCKRRQTAGIRKLNEDFLWPTGFGTMRKTDISRSLPDIPIANLNTVQKEQPIIFENSSQENDDNQSKVVEEVCHAPSVLSNKANSSTSNATLLRQKRKELLECELRLRTLELEDIEERLTSSKKSVASCSITCKLEIPKMTAKESLANTTKWVEQAERSENGIFEENPSEIKQLCKTISDAIKTVSRSPGQERFITRQVIEKDFPYFNGNSEEWPIFISQFKRISTLCGYSSEEKLIKLQKCLKGEAKIAVAGMMVSPDNIDLILNTLEMRFGRPDQIIEKLILNVRTFPQIRDNQLEFLIHFANHVSCLVATIKSLDFKEHLYNPQVLKDLVHKIPDTMKLRWGEKVMKKGGRVHLDDFSVWLNELAQAACYVSGPKINSKAVDNKTKFYTSFRRNETSLIVTDKKNFCSYCEKGIHKLRDCLQIREDDVEKRWEVVTKKKLCFSCLKNNHRTTNCRMRYQCGINNCKRYHNKILHKQDISAGAVLPTPTTNEDVAENPEKVLALGNGTKNLLLRMVNVRIYGNNNFLDTVALCDEASTVTLVDKTLIDKLGLQGKSKSLCLQWTNNMTSEHENSQCLDLDISGVSEGAKIYTLKGVHTVQDLFLPLQVIEKQDWKKYPHLSKFQFSEIKERPMILLGQDNIRLTIARKVIQGAEDELLASKTNLGWILHGNLKPTIKQEGQNYSFHICNHEIHDEELHQLVKQSFSLDALGIVAGKPEISFLESRALDIMHNTSRYIGNRYEIGLLWKCDNVQLPESKSVAIQRLKCVERKMLQDNLLRQKYCEKIQSYVEKGYARKLSPEERNCEGPRCWYLPHFPVFNVNKPTKLRLVFDAASKSNGHSLNDFLLPGPDLLQSLIDILIKFREKRIAFCADVREMFHQVCIRREDQSSQRFLWRDGEINRPWDTYEMQVMTFGATCSPACAQYIKNLNAKDHTDRQDVLDAIIKKHYVDDYLDCTDTVDEALQRITEVQRVQKMGGFQLVNWFSNSEEVMKSLSKEEKCFKDLNVEDSMQRVLGIFWDLKLDRFCFKIKMENFQNTPTKRQVLKTAMSIYDPLGIVVNLTVRGRILIQEIWKSGISWDDSINPELQKLWLLWLDDLKCLTKITVPRCYSFKIVSTTEVELHSFSDASQKAFASVVYIRIIAKEDVDIALVIAKARVAPIKQISIPRLELQAALMGSRLVTIVKRALDFEVKRIYMWTDSTTVLQWIKNDACKLRQLEAHRIGEIRETTDILDWNWIPSKLNVADLATRTYDTERSIMNDFKRWFKGPEFLYNLDKSTWPQKKEYDCTTNPENNLQKESVCVAIAQEKVFLPDICRFSKWLPLIKTTARIIKFVKILIARRNKTTVSINLTTEDLSNAEIEWIKQCQQESFSNELEDLRKNKQVRKQSPLRKLTPIVDEHGVIKLNGRINLAPDLIQIAKQPIILPSKHHYTQLLIKRYHEDFAHQGLETVINELRQRFWIIKIRSTVKGVVSKCQLCKKMKAKPKIPMMGQLPEFRLIPYVRPFTFTGIDYFGPLYVSVGRHLEKRWGVLFTCLSIRAVHLEVAHSLNTDSAIMAIKRMLCRRGTPKEIYTDNGTNFRGASVELKKIVQNFDHDKFREDLIGKGIDWKFIPPGAPHMGGAWERLVRSVKNTFHVILNQQRLKDELLLTLFAEAENIINSRPLTTVTSNPDDLEAITPNHLLLGARNDDANLLQNTSTDLRKQWIKTGKFVESFWKRWTVEYLPTLTKRTRWTDDNEKIKENDIVTVVDENVPRRSWKLGKVQTLFPGPDGRVRVVEVKTANGILKRPVSKLCKITNEEDQ